MGNKSSDLGDFQQNVGQVTGQLGVISAYFFAFFAIIGAIAFAYWAFVPFSTLSPIDGSMDLCFGDQDCRRSGESCVNRQCQKPQIDGEKTKHPLMLLFSVVLIALAIFSVIYARTLRDISQSSRGGAQVVGLMGEAQLARSLWN
jgi:hypothetical protein